jgi:alpha-galactosidase
MNVTRRQFLRLSSVSTGALLLSSFVNCPAILRQTIPDRFFDGLVGCPQEIVAETEEQVLSLHSTDGFTWRRQGLSVVLQRLSSGVEVRIWAPGVLLRSIRIRWHYADTKNSLHLGDAWERGYGDLGWRPANPERVMPWYWMDHDGKSTRGFGVKTGCAAMCHWQAGDGNLVLILDTRSGGCGVSLGERWLNAATVVMRAAQQGESAFIATRELCRLLCDKPHLPKGRMVGMLDWYYAYGKGTEREVVKESALFAKLLQSCQLKALKAFSLVDAGWAVGDRTCWPTDQTEAHPDFGDIHRVASEIQRLGLVPGIWTRPLCPNPGCPASMRLARDERFLDPSHPASLAAIQRQMRRFRSWGFEIIKHDFSTWDLLGRWGPAMGASITNDGWRFYDGSRTTAEIVLGLYHTLRTGCGRGSRIISCNGISHLTAGIFDYYRVGDDSAGSLENAVKAGVNSFAFRLPQQGTFYTIDPDCVSLNVPWEFERQFMHLVTASGALFQLSTRIENLQSDHLKAVRSALVDIGSATVNKRIEPLDWLSGKQAPNQWSVEGKPYEADWGGDSAPRKQRTSSRQRPTFSQAQIEPCRRG